MNDQVTALKIHVEKELSRVLGKPWVPECSINSLIAELDAINDAYTNSTPQHELGEVASVLIAESMAKNYLEVHYELTIEGKECPDMIITIQLKDGKTPHEKREEAEAELKQYKRMYESTRDDGIAEAHKCFALHLQCGTLTAQVNSLIDVLKPFAEYRRVADHGVFLSVGGGSGHAEVSHDDWTNALNSYTKVLSITNVGAVDND